MFHTGLAKQGALSRTGRAPPQAARARALLELERLEMVAKRFLKGEWFMEKQARGGMGCGWVVVGAWVGRGGARWGGAMEGEVPRAVAGAGMAGIRGHASHASGRLRVLRARPMCLLLLLLPRVRAPTCLLLLLPCVRAPMCLLLLLPLCSSARTWSCRSCATPLNHQLPMCCPACSPAVP